MIISHGAKRGNGEHGEKINVQLLHTFFSLNKRRRDGSTCFTQPKATAHQP